MFPDRVKRDMSCTRECCCSTALLRLLQTGIIAQFPADSCQSRFTVPELFTVTSRAARRRFRVVQTIKSNKIMEVEALAYVDIQASSSYSLSQTDAEEVA